MILTGDVGGTNTRLAILDPSEDGRFVKHASEVFPSADFASLEDAIDAFLASTGFPCERAAFGIAGPVMDGRCTATNLPWVIDAAALRERFGFKEVALLNDLEAQAAGIRFLRDDDFAVLQEGVAKPGNRALIAAGTGLGQAGLVATGSTHRVFATEGGHTDFAPHDELQIELLRFLIARHGRVSWERVVSGMGLENIFAFFIEGRGLRPATELRENPRAADISRAALTGSCEVADAALELFVTLYGAEAGNLGLKTLSVNGLFLGGGIAPKILPRLQRPNFLGAFTHKGRMSPLLESMPVRVLLDGDTALYGAAGALTAPG